MSIFDWLRSSLPGRNRSLSVYRRGMARARKGENQGAIDDYTAMIDMSETPPEMRAMALYNRALVYDAVNEAQAIEDLNTVLTMPTAQADVKTEAKRKLVRIERRSQRNVV